MSRHPSGGRTRRAALALLTVGALTGVTAVSVAATSVSAAPVAPAQAAVRTAAGTPVAGSYIVVLRHEAGVSARTYRERSDALADSHDASVRYRYTSAVQGFAGTMSAAQARRVAAHPKVAYVEQDAVMHAIATQSGATWGIDRLDQRGLPLDGAFTYSRTASNVNAYIIDTGIMTTHDEFGTRASVARDTVGDGQNGQDCNGHGTHVAGTVGGSTYGVAKAVRLYAVRVLDCSGAGTTSGVIAGVDWVNTNAKKPAVANMSLGGSPSASLDRAVRNAIANGVTFALAAGNSGADACGTSPARVTQAITVGATTITDARASFSNYGTCLDVFAPGANITSAWTTSTIGTRTISGTSMAAPHVAGAAALYLSNHTTASPATVRNAIVNAATSGAVISAGSGSPNELLYTGSF
jgi:subtilisin family serine protease